VIEDLATRDRITTALDTTFMVEAAAGTGKTTVLVRRIVETLAAGADVAGIAALTFTDKAAGELKLRVREGLEVARRDAKGPRRRSLDAALSRLEEAQVSTLHTFAQELLRERPIEAGVDPRFSPVSDGEATALFDEAFSRWLESRLASPTPALRRALGRPGIGARELAFAARELSEHRMLTAAWTRRPWDRAAALRAAREATIRAAAVDTSALRPSDWIGPAFSLVRTIVRRMERATDELAEGLVIELLTSGPLRKALEWGRGPATAKDALRAMVAELSTFASAASADLAFELRGELAEVVASYESAKARRGVLDMQDLIVRTHRLLVRDPSLRRELSQRYARIFVDEFQDTDATQVAILMLLAAEGEPPPDPFEATLARGKLFVVGDPKQSIYRFRHADLAVYEAVRTAVLRSEGEVLTLTSSFRATPPIQELVNAAFSEAMHGQGDGLQARYVPLRETREREERQPAVIALPVPEPYSKKSKRPRLTQAAIQASLPDAIAAFVAWLVNESGFLVVDRAGAKVPVQPKHVAILFSKTKAYKSSLVAPITRGLSEREVPHVALGSVALSEMDEGRALLAALSAIERTDDTLAVYATLHGPLFGFEDATLFHHSDHFGHLDPLRARSAEAPEELAPVAAALELLARLHRARNKRPAAETLHELCRETRAHVAFAIGPGAEQALLVLASLERRAAHHDHAGGLSFRSFVETLEEDERGRELTDDESGGVRIMTVHAAKGLEFPVVVLADPTSKPRAEVDRVVDARRGVAALRLAGLAPWELVDAAPREHEAILAESVRLAYVAATRARDLLVVPVVADDPSFPADGWLAPLTRVMAPLDPTRSEQAPLCPVVGSDTVLVRPDDGPRPLPPGLYETKGGAIAYFDPAALAEGRASVVRSKKLELLAKDADPAISAAESERHQRFTEQRASLGALASRPRLEATTATALAHGEGHGHARVIESVQVERAVGRPGGKRFGVVVHAILAAIPLDASDELVRAQAVAYGRLNGATAPEIEAAAVAASRALASPTMKNARLAESAGALRREVPISWELAPGRVVDGVVDLAYQLDGVWHVVDYKTDDPRALPPEGLAAYQAQVALYVGAIERATSAPATGALLFV
jgi:ATP-dependent exoDNAse (exonuclease V) beta subunit